MKRVVVIDCYSYGAVLGDQYPVNTYLVEWQDIFRVVKEITENPLAGIDRIDIRSVVESVGQAPVSVDLRVPGVLKISRSRDNYGVNPKED